MTKIDLTLDLPDGVARDAEAAGLLSARAVARLLREEIRRQALARLIEGSARVHAADIPPMSMEEIQSEVNAVRSARRLGQSRTR